MIEGAAVGAGLATAGLLVQAMVRNPVGDPYILGLSSGAGLAAVTVITTAGSTVALAMPAAAFAGATITGVVVFLVARSRGRLTPGRLVMVGIAIGQLLGGATSFLLLWTGDPDAQQQVLFWLLGSLAGATWPFAVLTAAVVSVTTAVCIAGGGRLNLLIAGDDAAAALGLDAGRVRGAVFVVVAMVTGTVVAASGSIGFVGLVVPNLGRLLVGADHRRALPVTVLFGALVVVWADTAARLVLAPTELPIGILTAAIGVPFFLLAVRRSGKGAIGVT